jgi:predicted tellurium resistance membrane protein TerC
VFDHGVSGRDLILLAGGLFLVAKATFEIHDKLEVKPEEHSAQARGGGFWSVIVQIGILDIVFSLDSVITAVGMAQHLAIMVAAMVIAVAVMLLFAGPIGTFVERHPTLKMLALSFLILIGVMLVAEAFGRHIEKGYIYFAMAFSLAVEILNLRVRRGERAPVALHSRFQDVKEGR